MANNFIQPGKVLDYVNTTTDTVVSGQVVLVGVILGVALGNIAPGQTGSVQIDGVFAVPKLAGAAIAQALCLCSSLLMVLSPGRLQQPATSLAHVLWPLSRPQLTPRWCTSSSPACPAL